MASFGLCMACTPIDLSKFPFSSFGGTGFSEPEHCYGQGDQPAPKGVMGGFVCTCECRSWPRGKRTLEEDIAHTEALEAAGICASCEKAPSLPDDCFCAECRQWITDNSEYIVDPIELLIGQHRLLAFLTNLDRGECGCGYKWEGGPGYWRQHVAKMIHAHYGTTYAPWVPAAEYEAAEKTDSD